MIIGKLNLEIIKNNSEPTRRRILTENLKREEKMAELREKVAERNTACETEDVEREWKRFREIEIEIIEISEKVLETKVVGRTRKKRIPWWNDQVRESERRKNKSFRRWMKTRRPEN